MFQNRGDGTYDEVGNLVGIGSKLDARGAATGDLDGDGDPDLVVYNRNAPTVLIYRNHADRKGRVVALDLQPPDPTQTAIGAQAIVRCGSTAQLRQLAAGSGFLSQSDAVLHVGLGACTEPVDVEVRWPWGEVSEWTDVPTDRRLTLTPGNPAKETALREPSAPRMQRGAKADRASTGRLSAEAPPLELETLGGDAWRLPNDGTMVVNFWATWCLPCREELPELAELDASFRDRGVTFVGVVMDEEASAEDVRAFLEPYGVTYQQVWGDAEVQAPFASLGSSAVGAIPLTAVIHDGMVRDVTAGVIDAGAIERLLTGLIGEDG